MNAAVYFSCTGQSKAVAEEIAARLSYPIIEMKDAEDYYENLILVFPVHCQGAPKSVKKFLKTAKAKYITLVATYGRMSAGNAVYEAYKAAGKRVVAAAALPSRHSYNADFKEAEKVPEEIYKKIASPEYIKIKRKIKAPFAGVFPSFRSRRLIKIMRNGSCDGCNVCGEVCPEKAIKTGEIKGGCTRCLKCVTACPSAALEIKKGFILKSYLKKPRREKIYIYV